MPAERVTSLAFSPCAATLAALCWGGTLHLFDSEPRQEGVPERPSDHSGCAAVDTLPADTAAAQPPAPGPDPRASGSAASSSAAVPQAPVPGPRVPGPAAAALAEHAPRVMAIDHALPAGPAAGLGLTLNPEHGPWRARARLPGRGVRPEETCASLLVWDPPHQHVAGDATTAADRSASGGPAPVTSVAATTAAAAGQVLGSLTAGTAAPSTVATADVAADAARGAAAGYGRGRGGWASRMLMSRRGEPVESCSAVASALVRRWAD